MPHLDLASWLEYLDNLHSCKIDLSLERIQSIASSLNLTHFSCPVITIAGTNGKGSCVAILAAIYAAHGYRVGSYTSPHLLRFNERIQINAQQISDQALIKVFEKLDRARGDRSLTFFELTTLAALSYFQQENLDVLLLEVGLGGRKDAVNVVEHDCAVITNIAFDHTDWLGDTLELIGKEKAGIIRPGKPVVCGDPQIPNSVIEQAAKLSSPLFLAQRDFVHGKQGEHWFFKSQFQEYAALPLPKLAQSNAAIALMVLGVMQSLPVSQQDIEQGLQQLYLTGRCQVVGDELIHIYDVAHNPHSIKYLAKRLKAISRTGKVLAVWGMLSDKNLHESVAIIKDEIETWKIAPLKAARAASLQQLSTALEANACERVQTSSSISQAYQAARKEALPGDIILCFGSFHTVAEVLLVSEAA